MILEKLHGPVVDAVRQFQLGQFAPQRRIPDRIERLREVKRIDVDKIAVYQHKAYGSIATMAAVVEPDGLNAN